MAYNSILENILYVIKMRGEYKAKTCQIFVNLSGFLCAKFLLQFMFFLKECPRSTHFRF